VSTRAFVLRLAAALMGISALGLQEYTILELRRYNHELSDSLVKSTEQLKRDNEVLDSANSALKQADTALRQCAGKAGL
jgi:hypothetical protein